MTKQKRTTRKTKPTTRRKTTTKTKEVDFFTRVIKGAKKLLSSV